MKKTREQKITDNLGLDAVLTGVLSPLQAVAHHKEKQQQEEIKHLQEIVRALESKLAEGVPPAGKPDSQVSLHHKLFSFLENTAIWSTFFSKHFKSSTFNAVLC